MKSEVKGSTYNYWHTANYELSMDHTYSVCLGPP